MVVIDSAKGGGALVIEVVALNESEVTASSFEKVLSFSLEWNYRDDRSSLWRPRDGMSDVLSEVSPDRMLSLPQNMINALLPEDVDAILGAEWERPALTVRHCGTPTETEHRSPESRPRPLRSVDYPRRASSPRRLHLLRGMVGPRADRSVSNKVTAVPGCGFSALPPDLA